MQYRKFRRIPSSTPHSTRNRNELTDRSRAADEPTSTEHESPLRRASDGWLVAGALVLALALRVGIVFATRHSYHPVNDSSDFLRIGSSIAAGHGFGQSPIPGVHSGSAFRTPLYPFLLGVLFAVFHESVTIARLFTNLGSVGFVAILGAVAWKLGGRRVGLVTLYLAALYPPFLLASYGIQYEAFFLLLLMGALLLALQWREQPSGWWLVPATGVTVGLAVLCRETGVFTLVPIWIWMWMAARRGNISVRGALGRLAVVTGCAVAVVTPWTIRNATTLHAFIPVSDSPGYALAGVYNTTTAHNGVSPGVWINPALDPSLRKRITALGPNATESDLTSSLQSAAINYEKSKPAWIFRLGAWNTVRMFDLRGFGDARTLAPFVPWSISLTEASVVAFWIVGPLGILGLFTRRGRQFPKALWTFPILIYLALAVSVGDIQYRVVLEPFAVLLTAVLAVTLYENRMTSRSEPGVSESSESA
jgi:4-amino-4-deoxy-L-arabinose transferase-like glycosyltransferase